MLSSGTETFLKVIPEKTSALEDIKDLSAEERQCRFPKEVKLKRMRRYSYINCMAECRSKIVFERCGCVPITTPNSGSYPICNGLDQILCIADSRGKFFRYCNFPWTCWVFQMSSCHPYHCWTNRVKMTIRIRKKLMFVGASETATSINMNQRLQWGKLILRILGTIPLREYPDKLFHFLYFKISVAWKTHLS